MSQRVRITDVSPRDGLQNEPGIISTADKVRLVELLAKTGVDEIEVTSFVSPKWVPQLADSREVLHALNKHGRGLPEFSVLVPNAKGMDSTLSADVFDAIDKVSVFTAASETFSLKNTNASIAETIERFRPVIRTAHDHRFTVRGYVSCAIACPFEGPISPDKVAAVCDQLRELGVDELDIGDTIGAGRPETVGTLLTQLRTVWPMFDGTTACAAEHSKAHPLPPPSGRGFLTLHLHDTFGRAAECVKVALDKGVRSFDGSVAGLGGCPYASTMLPDGTIKRAPGNISTELLVNTIHDAGYETGVDLAALAEAAAFARSIVAKNRSGASA